MNSAFRPNPIVLSAPRVPRVLGWIVLVLGVLHIGIQFIDYQVVDLPWLLTDLFDMNEEFSFPTWFSSGVLLLCAGLLFVTGRLERAHGRSHGRFWYALSAGFLFLSMDEVVGVHESINTATDMAWTIPGAIVVAVVAVSFAPFLIRLPSRTRWMFLGAGALYVGGAVGVEHGADSYIDVFGQDNLGYQLMTALEEILEMLGAIAMVNAVLDFQSRRFSDPFAAVVIQAGGVPSRAEILPLPARPGEIPQPRLRSVGPADLMGK